MIFFQIIMTGNLTNDQRKWVIKQYCIPALPPLPYMYVVRCDLWQSEHYLGAISLPCRKLGHISQGDILATVPKASMTNLHLWDVTGTYCMWAGRVAWTWRQFVEGWRTLIRISEKSTLAVQKIELVQDLCPVRDLGMSAVEFSSFTVGENYRLRDVWRCSASKYDSTS
jgi:hypothetical protein